MYRLKKHMEKKKKQSFISPEKRATPCRTHRVIINRRSGYDGRFTKQSKLKKITNNKNKIRVEISRGRQFARLQPGTTTFFFVFFCFCFYLFITMHSAFLEAYLIFYRSRKITNLLPLDSNFMFVRAIIL